MTIDQHTYHMIRTAFSPVPPEAGGILGMVGGQVCAFIHDPGTPTAGRCCYTPNVELLNEMIAQWMSVGIRFCGIIHSHPPGQRTLSEGDVCYIQAIMDCMPEATDSLYFPVIIPGESVYAYLAQRGSAGITITLEEIQIAKEK